MAMNLLHMSVYLWIDREVFFFHLCLLKWPTAHIILIAQSQISTSSAQSLVSNINFHGKEMRLRKNWPNACLGYRRCKMGLGYLATRKQRQVNIVHFRLPGPVKGLL